MMKKHFFLLVISFYFAGCGVVKELNNISKLQFRLEGVQSVTLGGLPVNNKTSLKDFSSLDILKLSTRVIRGDLPLKFLLNIEVKNPNAENNAVSHSKIMLSSFPWRLFLNGKEAVRGNISSPVKIPGNKYLSHIPVQIKFNLVNFIAKGGYKEFINLALNLVRKSNSPTQLELFAKPVVDTPIGKINYPKELKIISMDFSY